MLKFEGEQQRVQEELQQIIQEKENLDKVEEA